MFEVSRDGRYVLVIERGWKVVKEISLGTAIARWFSKVLEACMKSGSKEYHSAHREGVKGYIAQRCSNSRGCYMALVEYGGGGRQSFIFIPEYRDNRGWWKLAEVLRDVGREDEIARPSQPGTTVAQHQNHPRSYREALQQPRRERVRGRASSDLLVCPRGAIGMQKSGSAAISVYAQSMEEGGRDVVGLIEEKEQRVLYEMKSQLGEMQDKINWLIRCIEEKKGVGVGL